MTPDIPSLRGELFVVSPADGRLCPVWLERHQEGSKSVLLVIGQFGDLSRAVPLIYRPRYGTDPEDVEDIVHLLEHRAGYSRVIVET